ncbi:hypothetical protein B296_00020112 [Ensete ventricosum]|uniref:Uncharacterized protein n=1 Tax=Ensete ventricosum TaxID=4639 RepID=A0A427AZM0_ENSVE|nr:hypothetical protein B296_00020112 [Ensete ventricosum]
MAAIYGDDPSDSRDDQKNCEEFHRRRGHLRRDSTRRPQEAPSEIGSSIRKLHRIASKRKSRADSRDQRSHLWEPDGGGTHTKRRQGRTDSLAGGTRRSELMLDLEFRRSKSLAGGVDLLDLMGGTAGEALGRAGGGERGDDYYYGFGQSTTTVLRLKNVVLGRTQFMGRFTVKVSAEGRSVMHMTAD